MKRALWAALLAATARAEDSVSAMGGYYYEYEAQNNRVVMNSIEATKDLPREIEASGYFLVDQVTSASAAFQGGADEVYQEYRWELGLAGHQRWGAVMPGLSFRRSEEPDYESTTVGLEVAYDPFGGATVVRVLGQLQDDDVMKRGVPSFNEDLDGYLAGVHVAQALHRNVQLGAGFEATRLDGYQSNPYRRCDSGALEAHPRRRQRAVGVAWGAWHVRSTRSTLYAGYRLYDDNWSMTAHTGEMRLTQRVIRPVEIEATWRPHRQTSVYFIEEKLGARYCTGDPKLGAFTSHSVEGVLRVSIPPFWFLREPRIEAAAGRLSYSGDGGGREPESRRIENRYGDAVLARLGGSFAF